MPLVPVDVCDAKRGKGDEGHCGEGQLCSLSICVCEIRREREREAEVFQDLVPPILSAAAAEGGEIEGGRDCEREREERESGEPDERERESERDR